MSYLFSLAKQDSDNKGRAEVILIWMVLTEIIHICGDHNWELQLVWVGFLVYNFTPLHGIRTSLFVLRIYFLIYEVLKGIYFNKAKDSYLLGKNPKLIHSYMRSVMLENGPNTIPLSSCKYIVMGEENHKINVCDDGYHLGVSRSGSEILKIDRVFAFTASDSAFTSKFPYWRDTCLSLALAKMLRRRFANLPLDEAGSRKALDFVLEGLIDYIGNNRDIVRDGSSRSESNPKERVFNIIKDELKLVSKFLHTKVPIDHHLPWYALFNAIGFFIVLYSGSFSADLGKAIAEWNAHADLVAQDAYDNCFFNIFRSGSEVLLIFSILDMEITYLLYAGSTYIQLIGFLQVFRTISWPIFYHVERHINGTNRISNSSESSSCSTKVLFLMASYADDNRTNQVTRARADQYCLSTVLDIKTESIVFRRIKVNVSILARLPKCIRRIIPIVIPDADQLSTAVEEAILSSFRHSGGRLTNGETSLGNYNMGDLNWACPPNGSTTEAILIWHIATTLFFWVYNESLYLDNNTHQEPSDQQYMNQLSVALQLSSYCRYLVAYLPQLLPDEVEWTKEMYESVIEEMVSIDCPSGRTTATHCYCYVLHATWHEESVVGKGVMLAKDLMKHHEDGGQVWKMLADFWPELILFIAPSDNVKGHEEILEREELITQVWALLTHAGILTRPKCTGSTASNEVSGDENV